MEDAFNNEIILSTSPPSNIELIKNSSNDNNNLVEKINKKNIIKKQKFKSKSNLSKYIYNQIPFDLEINYNFFITNEILKSHKKKKCNSTIRKNHSYFDDLNKSLEENNKKKKNKKTVKFNEPLVEEILIESYKKYNDCFIDYKVNKKCCCNFKCILF